MLRGNRTSISDITRRSLISRAVPRLNDGLTTLGFSRGAPFETEGQLVWKMSEWKHAKCQNLVNDPPSIKQMFDVVPIGNGKGIGEASMASGANQIAREVLRKDHGASR